MAAFHMHGHVLWARKDGRIEVRQIPPPVGDAVLGTPGPLKKGLAEELLAPVWTEALRRLRNVHAVVFDGYRFPETDDYAKRCLLHAIRDNRSALSNGRTHVVLGPDSEKDVKRLAGMLQWAGVTGTLVHPMGCEDFFAVFERDRLFTFRHPE